MKMIETTRPGVRRFRIATRGVGFSSFVKTADDVIEVLTIADMYVNERRKHGVEDFNLAMVCDRKLLAEGLIDNYVRGTFDEAVYSFLIEFIADKDDAVLDDILELIDWDLDDFERSREFVEANIRTAYHGFTERLAKFMIKYMPLY